MLDQVQETNDIVHAVTVNRAAQRRLCEAAKISPIPDWRNEGTPEPDLREMTRQLAGRDFDDLVKPQEVLSRTPYICVVCGDTFTSDEFRQTRHAARTVRLANPFTTGHQTHIRCTPEGS